MQILGSQLWFFFKIQFKNCNSNQDFSLLSCIPQSIIQEENEEMTKLPDQAKVTQVVFQLNGLSVVGSNGFSGLFFQNCWDLLQKTLLIQ